MYNELVYHLDLCILAYHQYAQTLIWPFDPYYEQMALGGGDRRTTFMAKVRDRFNGRGETGGGVYHGPGRAFNPDWTSSFTLDPIIVRYDHLSPWNPAFTRAQNKWTFYRPPSLITNNIGRVWMCSYNAVGADPTTLGANHAAAVGINLAWVADRPRGANNRSDHLYCFEGGTGCVVNTASAMSLMGCILDRTTPAGYDVHIVFRGSRSGSAGRALRQGSDGYGNPDWVTDMDFTTVVRDNQFSTHGSVCRGFSRAIKTCIPTILRCLEAIHTRRQSPPQNIYVTGHSLGAALATQFATAMVLGTVHGPNGRNLDILVRTWPWMRLRLLAYSSPVAGGKSFSRQFNSRIFCRRVTLSADPITSEVRHRHVGQEVYITGENTVALFSYHEPSNVRARLIRKLAHWDDDMTGIPAPNVADPLWPWKLYDTFGDMIARESVMQNRDRLGIMLRGLDTDVPHYMAAAARVFSEKAAYKRITLEATRVAKQNAITTASARVGNTVGMDVDPRMSRLAVTVQGVRTAFENTGKHLGFILILAEMAANAQLTWEQINANVVLRACLQ